MVLFDTRTIANLLTTAGVSNYRPAGQMWPATTFSVARGSIQKRSSNLHSSYLFWYFFQHFTV